MTIGALYLMRPEWLWALLPVALLLALLVLTQRHTGNWSQVISPDLLPYLISNETVLKHRRRLPWIALGWVLAVLALCGPSLHKIPQPLMAREDALVVLFDLSYSMKANDIAPSRLDQVRQKIIDLLARRQEGQTALISYAGDAHVVAPLTDDGPTIANLLPALSPDMMPVPGSATDAAVKMAIDLLASGGSPEGHIVLFTDGVNPNQFGTIADALNKAEAGFTILGVGTAEGAPLPLPQGGFLRDRNKAIVVPTLDEDALIRLASEAGGQYLPLQIDSSDIDHLLVNAALPGREALRNTEHKTDHWQDQGYYFVLLILPLAAMLFRRGLLVSMLLPLLLLSQPRPAEAAELWDKLWLTADQQGQQALQAGDQETASELFENPSWRGTAAYQHGDYEAAADNFAQGDSADDWYNRGNALAHTGDLDGAIDAFEQSLSRAPEREDASANLELVKALKKQQEQREQEQEQSSDQQDQNSSQQNQADQDQRSQNEQTDSASNQNQHKQDEAHNQQQNQQQDQTGQSEQNPQSSNQQTQDGNSEPSQQQQPEDQAATGEQEQEQEQAQTVQGEPVNEDEDANARNSVVSIDPEQAERDQALEQWLRRVPDDPSGLLRRKFLYESQQRQRQGEEARNDQYW
ncbi:MAG: vWA domain-containing protein [Parahaliea sp.]